MPSEEKEKSRGLYWVVGAVILVPVLYVLSIGPVVVVWHRAGGNMDAVRAAYFPVILLHDQTPLRKPLEWYMRLWGVD